METGMVARRCSIYLSKIGVWWWGERPGLAGYVISVIRGEDKKQIAGRRRRRGAIACPQIFAMSRLRKQAEKAVWRWLEIGKAEGMGSCIEAEYVNRVES
jgi:hypothetical protein